jgi:hypothetical protein
MRFFDSVAESAFRTAPDGRRLFYSFGPWSRPYIVPDAATEQRLIGKQRWMLGVLLALIVLAQPLLRSFDPDIMDKSYGFLGYVGLVLLGYQLVQSVILRTELRSLARAESRLSLHEYYASMAASRSATNLIVSMLLALVFIGVSVVMLVRGTYLLVDWVVIGVFAFTGVTTAYALVLKLSHKTP